MLCAMNYPANPLKAACLSSGIAVSLLQTMKTIWATVSLIAFCLMSTGTRSQEFFTQMKLPAKGHVYVLRTVDGKTQLGNVRRLGSVE